MSELGLNDHHQSVILNYMRFARYQRTQNLKAIDYAFQDVLDSRLLEDTYTADEVRDLLTGLCKVVHADVETELISSTHTTVLLLKQLFEQAEKWHLRLQPDLSELENREKIALVKALEINESPILKPDKNPPTPTKVKLEPMAEVSGSLKLLKLEIERLKEDRSQLLEALQATKHKEHTYLGELNKLKKEFNEQQNELSALKQLSQSSPSQLEEVEDELSEVRNLMASNLQVSESNKQQLESELLSTKQKVAEVQAQLSLAEQELERKFSQTAAYTNMKKIMNKKNEQIKELRGRLLKYEPEETTTDEQN